MYRGVMSIKQQHIYNVLMLRFDFILGDNKKLLMICFVSLKVIFSGDRLFVRKRIFQKIKVG
jgi:hypothetical protein